MPRPRLTPAPTAESAIAYTVDDAVRVSGIGRSKLYQLVAAGQLKMTKVGRRSLIPAESLRALIGEAA